MDGKASIGDELLGTILATVPVGIVIVEPETLRVIVANAQYRRLLDPEWHDRDLTGRSLAECVPGFALEAMRAFCVEVRETGQPLHFAEYAHEGFARGTTYWQYDISPVASVNGARAAVMFTVTDITAQVHARREGEATNTALASIAAISATITASLDFDEVMDHLLTAIVPLIPYDRAFIILDDGPEMLHVAAARYRDVQEMSLLGLRIPKGQSVNGQVFRDARPIRVRDFHDPGDEGHNRFRPGHVDPNFRSAISVPLVARERVIGTFYLVSHTPGAFTDSHLHRLAQLAPQAASAVANALLYREATARATELEVANDVAITVAASLDFDEVMDRMLTAIVPLIPYQRALVLLDGDADHLCIVAARQQRSQDTRTIGARVPKRASLSGRVFQTHRSLHLRDIHDSTETLMRAFEPNGQAPDYHAVLCVPLVARERVIGTLYLTREAVGAFTDADLRRLELFAPKVATAVANAVLYREATEYAKESATLSEVATAVAASLSLPDVLHLVLDKIAVAIGYDQAQVALAEDDGARLRIVSARGNRFGPLLGTTMPVAGSNSGRVFTVARPVLVPDLSRDPEWIRRGYYPTTPPPETPRAAMLVPLQAGGVTVGVLQVVREVANGYSEEDLRRLARFASPIAVAIANARLYAQVQEQVRELRHLNTSLEEANRHKSEFLATMSHELRTPLNAILGFAELLRDDLVTDPEEQRLCLDDIHGSARHLLKLVNDVLDIARIEAGAMKLHREAFSLRDEITEAERVIAPLVARHGQTLTVSHDPQLPPVYADRDRVRQVVLNLLANANKFTPGGGSITVVTDRTGAAARVRVMDTGIGIHPDDAHKVFEEFRQIDGSLARKYEGTGLGLALSKRFMEMLGGAISFESEPGVGSTFTLLLPFASAAAAQAEDDIRVPDPYALPYR